MSSGHDTLQDASGSQLQHDIERPICLKMLLFKVLLVGFFVLFMMPLGVSAASYWLAGAAPNWRTADRSSTGLLAPASQTSGAVVRIFAAPTVSWRGVFAVHCWIVLKPSGALSYTRYDYTAWGEPIRVNGFPPDGRWFGRVPETVFAADGPMADAIIPRMQGAIDGYAWRSMGDYRAWPGPNSNTFVAAVLDAVPEIGAVLPPTAIGKDYPYDGRWLRLTPSRTGAELTLGGYAGFTIGWVEGIELNILGAVAGLDFRRPAIKLPGLGRLTWHGSWSGEKAWRGQAASAESSAKGRDNEQSAIL